MSFSMRDRPSLRDRLRGKSGDEILEELSRTFDVDRKNFFEDGRNRGRDSGGPEPRFGFPRGFPFEEDVSTGKSKLREHLADLAQRHPEFADQLTDWADLDRAKVARCGEPSDTGHAQSRQPDAPKDCGAAAPHRVIDASLRNTVPDMQSSHVQQEKANAGQGSGADPRGQRSQSAPPDAPQPSSKEIPIQVGGPPEPTPSATESSASSKPSQERYIPIFVEGRGEVIVNKPNSSGATQAAAPPPQPQPPFGPPPRQKKPVEKEEEIHVQTQPPEPPPPPQSPPLTPLDLVAQAHKEVLDLKQRIDSFKGSKTDREYVYLDEMLTRNLLKLDNIDSEGKEEVRAARKEVINLVQQCIATLEASVPSQNP